MSVEEKIRRDLRQAVMAKKGARAEALRYLLSLIQKQALRQESGQLGEQAQVAVLQKELKAKQEALEMFRKSGRSDLIAKEEEEISIVKRYLPAGLGAEEIEAIIKKMRAGGKEDFGSLMGAVMAEVKGRAAGGQVAELVKKELSR